MHLLSLRSMSTLLQRSHRIGKANCELQKVVEPNSGLVLGHDGFISFYKNKSAYLRPASALRAHGALPFSCRKARAGSCRRRCWFWRWGVGCFGSRACFACLLFRLFALLARLLFAAAALCCAFCPFCLSTGALLPAEGVALPYGLFACPLLPRTLFQTLSQVISRDSSSINCAPALHGDRRQHFSASRIVGSCE